ncbi:PQQ-binding-like beta-propeller repeat protein [Micromonospora sp. NPDC051925]|uniref:outer membrane protein assembly factor BamB family protein n=1 Tax=Micromonospora sp. NPDC051925 TaxID=3364288 RepID=UPI0037CC3231
MTVIELGVVGHDGPSELPPRPPRPLGPPLRAVLLVLLVLLTMAGAAPGPTRLDRLPVPDVLEPGHRVVGDLLVLTEPASRAPDAWQLMAVGLSDGRVRWRAELPAGEQLVALDAVGDDVVVSTAPGGEPVSMLLDHADGRVRWRQPGSAVPTGDGGLLLEDVDPDRITVRGVDAASGEVRWSVESAPATPGYRAGARGIEELVLVSPAGRAEVYDVGTGVRRLTFAVPPARDDQHLAQPVGDVLVVDDEPGRVAGYDLESGQRRWEASLDSPGRPSFAYDCGGAVCLHTPAGTGTSDLATGTRVLDPATGRVRWATDEWRPLWAVGDRLLGVRGEVPGQERFALLDPVTGRVRADLGRWRLVNDRLSAAPFLVTQPVAADRHLLAELDVDSGEARIMDVLPERWTVCSRYGRILVCWREGHRLGVWRLPG